MSEDFDNDNDNYNNDTEYVEQYINVNSIRKNTIIIIKGKPCKVVDMTVSKPGKHGSAKASILACDILTDKKIQTILQTSSNIAVPKMSKDFYILIDINENDKILSVLNNDGISKDYELNCNKEILTQMKEQFSKENKDDILVEILSCMGKTRILSIKISK